MFVITNGFVESQSRARATVASNVREGDAAAFAAFG